MTRPIWTGSISFGLVSVPVKAYSAVRDNGVRFHQIDRTSGSRIQHRNVSATTGEPVEREAIVMGYEVGDGRYVTFERSELEDLRPNSTRAIEVRDFVALDEIDPVYFQKTYWLGPASDAAVGPYQLLHAAMEDRGRAAIGTVVMRNKEYVAAIRPLDGALAMSTMRFADEVIDRADIPEVPADLGEPDPKALGLAVQIVDSLAGSWDPEQYHDDYLAQVEAIIAARATGETLVVDDGSGGATSGGQLVDLMDALRASVEAAKASRALPGVSDPSERDPSESDSLESDTAETA